MESDGKQWAAQHFQLSPEVLISWELVSRGATVILWRKGDFSQHLWWGESNLVECTESHDSGLAMQKPKGRGMPRVYLGIRNVKPPGNLPSWEEYSVPEQQMSGLKKLTACYQQSRQYG